MHISTPIPFRVGLAQSALKQLDGERCTRMPQHPVPPHTAAEASCITTNRSTDLLGATKEVGTIKRQIDNVEEIVVAEIVGN